MEHIQAALAKAKEARIAGIEVGPHDENLHKITYTDTPVKSVNTRILRQSRLIGGVESTRWTETFRQLRTRVLQLLHSKGWNTIAVTSAEAQTGKSLIAINLAISVAMELDHSVLLVDTNIENPSLHKFFDLPEGRGLSDFLNDDGDGGVGEMLVNPGIRKLILLPAGSAVLNASEMLGSKKMARLVNELKSKYQSRIIIFDVPPIIDRSDALAFLPYIDAALMVVEEGRSKKQQVKQAIENLTATPVLGTVLNKSKRNVISEKRPGRDDCR